MTDLPPPRRENRAVSAIFRLMGGRHARHCGGEGEVLAAGDAMHAGEQRFFAVMFPLTVAVAVWHALHSFFGLWAAWLLCLPAALMLLQVLPFVLAGRTPCAHWRLWLAATVIWAWFHRDAPVFIAAFAWTWLGIAAANTVAALGIALRDLMRLQGSAGVAWRMMLFFAAHFAAAGIGWRFGWQWFLVLGAGIAALYCLAVLRPNSQWLGDVIRHSAGPPLMTFDDGPDPESTPELLDLLDARGVKAVFFLIGEHARRHPELAREIARRGHEIGNHTLTHPQATFWCAGPQRTAREIQNCQKLLAEITGTAPRYFRAPVGHRNLFTHPVAAACGLRVVGWSLRGYDADARVPTAQVIARITLKLRPRDIVLLHDGRPDAADIAAAVLDAPAFSPSQP